jgi:hypothetical protein
MTGEVRNDVSVPGMTTEELKSKNEYLKAQLAHATNVAEITSSAKHIKLFQNMPNPFNGQTTISFSIPDYGPVQLSVTDLSGNVVQVLLNQTLPIGVHRYDFDASLLPPGVYLITLNFNSQIVAKKMILMK